MPEPRTNPFEPRCGAAEAAVVRLPDELTRALATGRRCLLLVGPTGMGKSAHLTALAAWLEARGATVARTRLERGHHPTPPVADWWLMDEAQWLPPLELRRLVDAWMAAGRGLIVASHRDPTRLLKRHRPLTWRLRGVRDDAALRELLAVYLTAAGRDPGQWPLAPGAARRWRQAAGGNVEASLRLAYELAEDQPLGRVIDIAAVEAATVRLARDAPDVLAWRRREREHRR